MEFIQAWKPRDKDRISGEVWQGTHRHPLGWLLLFYFINGETEARAAQVTCPRVMWLVQCKAGIRTQAQRSPEIFFLCQPSRAFQSTGLTWPDLFLSYENTCQHMSQEGPPWLLQKKKKKGLCYLLLLTSLSMSNTIPI